MKKYKTILVSVILLILLIFIFLRMVDSGLHDSAEYRNGLRLREVNRTRASLEVYFGEHGYYPNNLDEFGGIKPFVVFQPEKIKNPACPIYELYKYIPTEDNKNYSITFCLPEDSNSYKAGYQIYSKDTIK